MNEKLKEMFKDFEFNEKPEELISGVNGMALPDDYLAFIREHNGGEGPFGENGYGCFYRIEELQEVNDDSGDTYMTISPSLEKFLIKMDDELAD